MVGAAGSAIAAKSQNKAAKKQAAQQYSNDMEAAKLQRQWQLEDRDEERAYNRKELEETRAYSRDVLKNLVDDAQEAGFNPLSVLRSGGGGSYNAAAGLAPLSATPISRSAPVRQAPGQTSVLGAAASSAATNFLQSYDPFADQKREQEYRLVESQIAALNASTLSGARYGAASYPTGNIEPRASGKAGVLGVPSKPSVGEVTVTNPWETLTVDPNARDASAAEERYGEILGSGYGGYVLARDWLNNVVPKVSSAVEWVRDNYSRPVANKIISAVTPAKKPKVKDNFDSPFPEWAW